jgi:hypothetical protein
MPPAPVPQTEESFGEILGARPAGAPLQAQPEAEESFGSVIGLPQPQAQPQGPDIPNINRPPSAGTRDIQGELNQQSEQVTRAVADLRENLPKAERKAAESHEGEIKQKAYDDLIAEVNGKLGPRPAPEEDFDDNAGVVNWDGRTITIPSAIGQALSHAITRARAGLGRNQTEVMNAYKARYGDDNVQVKDGEIYFRRSDGEKLRRVDRKGLANGLDLIEDLLADNSGPILETFVSALTDYGLLGGPLGGGVPLAAKAALSGVGAVTGGATGAIARDLFIKGIDAVTGTKQSDEEVSWFKEAAWNSGINLGAGTFLGAGKLGAGKFREILDSRALPRIQLLAQVKNEFEDFAKGLGFTGEGLRTAGERINDVVSATEEKLKGAVYAVESKAKEVARQEGIDALPVTGLVKKLGEVIGDYAERGGVVFDKDGLARVARASDSAMTDEEAAVAADMFGEKAVRQAQDLGRAAEASTQSALGSVNGRRTLEMLCDQYNNLLSAQRSKGGVDIQTIFDFIDGYTEKAQFSKENPINKTQQELFKTLRNAAAGDRNAALQTLLHGTGSEEEKIFKSAYENYHQRIDDVLQFRRSFDKQESAAKFAEALVQPDNVERILKLKSILGENSKEWDSFRGEWIGKLFEDATDASSGILNTGKILESMKGYGSEVLGQLLSKEEQGAIRKAAVAASEIPFSDLISPREKQTLDAMIALSPVNQYPVTRFRTLWRVIAGNEQAAKYLTDEAFLKAARNATTKTERGQLLSTQRFFKEATDQMKPVNLTRTMANGKKKTVSVLVPIRSAATGAVNIGLKSADRPEDTGEVDLGQFNSLLQ